MKSSKISIERVRKVISELNPIDDLVFRKLSESKEFCEEILREFMQDSELEVIENHSQNAITNIDRKSIILNHQRRVRYYSSVLTTNLVEKGTDFNSIPDSCMIYICNFDTIFFFILS